MAEVTQQQVVEYIKGISVLELSQLVKTLEAELGVSAAAAMPMAMPMAGGAGGGQRSRESAGQAGALREAPVRPPGADAAVRVSTRRCAPRPDERAGRVREETMRRGCAAGKQLRSNF